jgi:1-phosphatidylinositol-4-phosphate 5-kinase
VYTTYDGRFVIKTISTEEKLTLLNRLLSGYLERVMTGDSALVRVLGVFQVQCVGNYATNLLLMHNVSLTKHFTGRYDLKGSTYSRANFDISSLRVGLDTNFLREVGRLDLDPQDAERLLRRVTLDSAMLSSKNIMDYSLLVTVCTCEPRHLKHYIYRSSKKGLVYLIAVIDILQEYNLQKKAETCWKTEVKRVALSSLSSVEPELYAARLIAFLGEVI